MKRPKKKRNEQSSPDRKDLSVSKDEGKEKSQKDRIANFDLRIQKQIVIKEEEDIRERRLELSLRMKNGDPPIPFTISSDQFHNRKLQTKIFKAAGPSAIIYGSVKDLAIDAQENSGAVPEITVRSQGLTPDGNYISQGMIITPTEIRQSRDIYVDLGDGNFSRHLGFLYPDPRRIRQLGKHFATDLLELKDHRVTYPYIGHVSLAPFASVISPDLKKERPVVHLEGPSGGGKTFLGILGMSVFGNFGDRVPSWISTANSLEVEGYFFRDSLYLIDDYKPGFVPQHSVVRILQGYSGDRGRSRLNSNGAQKKTYYIRGLLLTTGEGFIGDIESVTGRTICLRVEAEKNIKAGENCKKYSGLYRSFTPGLIHSVISKPDWKDRAKEFVNDKINVLHRETMELSNGLRAASNWALNALGFEFFITYLVELGVITRARKEKMADEHMEIARSYLREQMDTLRGENPAAIFFRILGQKLQAGSISIQGLKDMHSGGRCVGQLRDGAVLIFPDLVLEVLAGHFHTLEARMPFNRNSLRDALAQEGLIRRPKDGRWSTQFRDEAGIRHNGWAFDKDTFQKRIAI